MSNTTEVTNLDNASSGEIENPVLVPFNTFDQRPTLCGFDESIGDLKSKDHEFKHVVARQPHVTGESWVYKDIYTPDKVAGK